LRLRSLKRQSKGLKERCRINFTRGSVFYIKFERKIGIGLFYLFVTVLMEL